jgi:hypothetical protein
MILNFEMHLDYDALTINFFKIACYLPLKQINS